MNHHHDTSSLLSFPLFSSTITDEHYEPYRHLPEYTPTLFSMSMRHTAGFQALNVFSGVWPLPKTSYLIDYTEI